MCEQFAFINKKQIKDSLWTDFVSYTSILEQQFNHVHPQLIDKVIFWICNNLQ